MLVFCLQITISLTFFVNKVLVLVGKKSGWLFGAFAALLAIYYFYAIELYVYTATEIGLSSLMLYGFLATRGKKQWVETTIRVVTATTMTVLAWFAFNGLLTIVELVSAFGLLTGTYLLARGNVRQGWLLGVLAHLCGAYLGYHKEQLFFADFQVASAVVSLVGVVYGNFETKK